jgi:hypothetical protein
MLGRLCFGTVIERHLWVVSLETLCLWEVKLLAYLDYFLYLPIGILPP